MTYQRVTMPRWGRGGRCAAVAETTTGYPRVAGVDYPGRAESLDATRVRRCALRPMEWGALGDWCRPDLGVSSLTGGRFKGIYI